MRILFTIAHFFNPSGEGKHASQRKDPRPRIQALAVAIASLHQVFSKSQCTIDIGQRVAVPANQLQSHEIDIVICTTSDYHLLDRLLLPAHFYKHHPTQAEPMLLGFACQEVLRDSLGEYDYYCFLEDDLIISDPWFFIKLAWFTKLTGTPHLLQPNRYEVSPQGLVRKAYIDGDLAPRVTAPFQNVRIVSNEHPPCRSPAGNDMGGWIGKREAQRGASREEPEFQGQVMGSPVIFRRALNPHSGCYFLNGAQMAHWAEQSYFLDRDTSFVGPLESAATLGIMKTFKIYKPAPHNAAFLEIQHYGNGFLSLIGGQVRLPTD
ncbi:MAG: calcium-binding protein [Hormoscilla sp. GM7CHS1pb]|nr:calcium-binding protein [Hormoscilla sp. GM7CHS1pb]